MKFSKSINKQNITQVARNNRQKAIAFLWGYEAELSPSAANIVTELDEPDLIADCSKDKIYEMMNGKKVQTNKIYEYLLSNYQRGVIPVLLAVALQPQRRRLVIYHGQSVLPFSPELWEAMDAAPEEYALELVDISASQQRYIDALEDLFREFIIEQEKKINSFTYLQNAMQRFLIGQPKYVQAAKNLTPRAEKLRDALKNYQYPPHYFFFELLPSILGEEPFDKIQKAIWELQTLIPRLYRECSRKVEKLFEGGIVNWARSLPADAKHRLFDSHEEKLLARILQSDQLTDTLLSEIAVFLTGFNLEDFDTLTKNLFFNRLKDFKSTIERQPSSGTRYLLRQVDETEKEKQGRIFCGEPYTSEYGRMFYHEVFALMREYDRGVPLAQRRQALCDILTGGDVSDLS